MQCGDRCPVWKHFSYTSRSVYRIYVAGAHGSPQYSSLFYVQVLGRGDVGCMGLFTLFVFERSYLRVRVSQVEKTQCIFCSETGEVFSCFPPAGATLASGPAPAKVVFPAFASFCVNFGTDNKTEVDHMANP